MRLDKASCGNLSESGWPAEQCVISDHDRKILRGLAQQLKALAERPVEEEKAKLWIAHNGLQQTRPVILADPENGWNEIFPWEKTIQCEGEMAGDWEMWLRKEICWAENIKDDKPITAQFCLPYCATDSKWGIHEERIGDFEHGGAYVWKSPLAEMDEDEFENCDLASLIKTPVITVDWEASNKAFEIAQDVFDGLLTVVRRHKWWWSPDLSLSYSNLRGMENMMCDFYDFPDKVHEMMRLFTDGYKAKFKYLEDNGLLYDNSKDCYIGSGGIGYTDELNPVDPSHVLLREMWGFNEAQETSEVSPDMVGEFLIPYQIELADLFGLNYYGCCEGLDRRWEHVKKLPRLRRVSVSQWADIPKMSDMLQSDYVFAHKVSPTDIAVPQIDEGYIRGRLHELLAHCKANNNCVELIMKDNHTLANRPQNLYRWVEIAREEIARVYG